MKKAIVIFAICTVLLSLGSITLALDLDGVVTTNSVDQPPDGGDEGPHTHIWVITEKKGSSCGGHSSYTCHSGYICRYVHMDRIRECAGCGKVEKSGFIEYISHKVTKLGW